MRKTDKPHWIRHSHLFGPDEYKCSRCGAVFREKHPVCPHCGVSPGSEKKADDWVEETEELTQMLDDD